MTTGQHKGTRNYHAGQAAEAGVAVHYENNGFKVIGSRVRIAGAEIDMIVQHDTLTVFVEVKFSATHDRAAHALSPAQLNRIFRAAEVYLAEHNFTGQSRVDLATVDALGSVRVIENVMPEF